MEGRLSRRTPKAPLEGSCQAAGLTERCSCGLVLLPQPRRETTAGGRLLAAPTVFALGGGTLASRPGGRAMCAIYERTQAWRFCRRRVGIASRRAAASRPYCVRARRGPAANRVCGTDGHEARPYGDDGSAAGPGRSDAFAAPGYAPAAAGRRNYAGMTRGAASTETKLRSFNARPPLFSDFLRPSSAEQFLKKAIFPSKQGSKSNSKLKRARGNEFPRARSGQNRGTMGLLYGDKLLSSGRRRRRLRRRNRPPSSQCPRPSRSGRRN